MVSACVALALGSGCSALRIGYSTAPDLVYWWIDRYIDFNDAQTPRAREAIAQWFAWNRKTQVPDYAAQLAKARVEVLADTTPARVCEWQAEIVQRAERAFERIAPAAADLLPTVTTQQIQYLERRYDKYNEEYRDDYLEPDPARRADKSLKRVLERAETLYGTLDDAQRAKVSEALQRSPFDPEFWFAERRLRQQDVVSILRKFSGAAAGGATHDQALAALRGYADRLEHSPRENYRRYTERLTAFNCAFAASLHNATTSKQRRTAADNLAGWEGDLRAIAAAKEPATSPSPN